MSENRYQTGLLSWKTILNVWQKELWPNRTSAIETHSAMTWPYENSQPKHDMRVFDYMPYFMGVYDKQTLIGVNSGHRTSIKHFRSRGLWVHPSYRRQGVSQMLFQLTEEAAHREGAEMIWSVPRKTALSAYQHFGFETVGGFFTTETAESNIYAIKKLLREA